MIFVNGHENVVTKISAMLLIFQNHYHEIEEAGFFHEKIRFSNIWGYTILNGADYFFPNGFIQGNTNLDSLCVLTSSFSKACSMSLCCSVAISSLWCTGWNRLLYTNTQRNWSSSLATVLR